MAQLSGKRQQIEKSLSTTVGVASVAVFVTIFSLISVHALYNKLTFQNRVISAKTTARNQLKTDITAAGQLTSSYSDFNGITTNLLGQGVTGNTNDNSKIVLDSLPSSYDFPALATSLQALLNNQGVTIDSIGGTDESATVDTSPGSPLVPMAFTFSVNGPYQNIQNIISTFEKSIRPFQFQTISLSGNQSDLSMSITAQTFFQPTSKFTITTKGIH